MNERKACKSLFSADWLKPISRQRTSSPGFAIAVVAAMQATVLTSVLVIIVGDLVESLFSAQVYIFEASPG
jgi:hypothetical protein